MLQSTCPKCHRPLEQSGEAIVGDSTYPVFQCDECVQLVQFGDGVFESAVSFALDEQGRRFDPGDPPPELN